MSGEKVTVKSAAAWQLSNILGKFKISSVISLFINDGV